MSTRGTRRYPDLAAGRKWSGLPLNLWRQARKDGHHLEGGQISRPFSMADGFHCSCHRWAVHQEEVGESAAISNIRLGYELWAEHIRSELAPPAG